MAVAAEVLRRGQSQPLDRAVVERVRRRPLGLAHRNFAVELPELVGDPRAARLGEDELQVGIAFEHSGEHEVPEPPLEEQVRLARPDCDDRRPGVLGLWRTDRDRVAVHRDADLLARGPERVEATLVEVHAGG